MPLPGLTAGGNPARAETGESPVRVVNPLEMSDWDEQVRQLPGHGFFHGTAWLRVLQETYGFAPCCLVEKRGVKLSGVLPLVEVQSWLTGKRGVALPFADFCPPLAIGRQTEQALIECALALGHERHWKYLEWRGLARSPLMTDNRSLATDPCPPPSVSFYTHTLDLTPGQEGLFKGFEGSVRRALRKAEQSGVQATVTTAEAAMGIFHQLYCITRQKHGLPPQPWKFFLAVHRHIIAAGQGFIVEATHDGRPVASAVFFTSGKQGMYKYGASDHAAQELRANNLVMWTAIKSLISSGFECFDFGRTSLDNEGLRRFKKSWAAAEKMLDYFCYNYREKTYVKQSDSAQGWHTRLFRIMPISLARIVGALLYKHTA
jgi:hypothetical protein